MIQQIIPSPFTMFYFIKSKENFKRIQSKPGEYNALHRHDTKDTIVLPSSFAFPGKELQVHVS